jgi:hypothetical protein
MECSIRPFTEQSLRITGASQSLRTLQAGDNVVIRVQSTHGVSKTLEYKIVVRRHRLLSNHRLRSVGGWVDKWA